MLRYRNPRRHMEETTPAPESTGDNRSQISSRTRIPEGTPPSFTPPKNTSCGKSGAGLDHQGWTLAAQGSSTQTRPNTDRPPPPRPLTCPPMPASTWPAACPPAVPACPFTSLRAAVRVPPAVWNSPHSRHMAGAYPVLAMRFGPSTTKNLWRESFCLYCPRHSSSLGRRRHGRRTSVSCYRCHSCNAGCFRMHCML